MTQTYATTLPNGQVGIITLATLAVIDQADFEDEESWEIAVTEDAIKHAARLPKTMFELSRASDVGRFNRARDTLARIERGLPGHFPLRCIEIDPATDLPADRKERNNWEIFEGKVRVKPA